MEVTCRKICNIDCEISKKNIKNMHIYVSPPDAKVTLSVPLSVKDSTIDLFVKSRLQEIKENISKINDANIISKREYVDGETFYYLGNKYYTKIFNSNEEPRIDLVGGFCKIYVKNINDFLKKEQLVKNWQKQKLSDEIQPIIKKYENKLGIKINKYIIRNIQSHWGSCNENDKIITLNRELITKTVECIEYIVLHEMIHILVHKHNDDFVKLLDQYLPNWKKCQELLNNSCFGI